MATWIEIRCERRGAGRTVSNSRCWSDDNADPTGMAYDDNGSVLLVLTEVRAQAKKEGWKRKREGWVCPGCIEFESK